MTQTVLHVLFRQKANCKNPPRTGIRHHNSLPSIHIRDQGQIHSPKLPVKVLRNAELISNQIILFVPVINWMWLVIPDTWTIEFLKIFSHPLKKHKSDEHGNTECLKPIRKEVYEGGEIIDITHRFTPNTPSGAPDGIGEYIRLLLSMKNGSDYNFSELKLPVHTGTHVDAPGHMYDNYFDAGFDVDTLDLRVLNGPGLLIDVPRHENLTAEVMKSLNIPRGIQRVIFRTSNTDRKLMWKKEFDSSYVGFMKNGAQWLVDNTDIKLVGIDYLSVAAFDDLISAHLVFLKSREIILVEGLKLDNVQPGLYNVHCLPLRILGAEGSPIRCILIK